MSGLIYEHLGWHAIFWSSAAIGIVLIVAVLAIVPESAIRTRGRFDYGGAVLLSIALTSLLLAISKGGTWGWTSEPTLGLFLVALVVLVVWVPFELRVSQPMVTSAPRPAGRCCSPTLRRYWWASRCSATCSPPPSSCSSR